MLIKLEDITIESFRQIFNKIIKLKESSAIAAVSNNPRDLFRKAKNYGTHFSNNSWGWTSNIWNRSAAGSIVVEEEDELKAEHKQLMLRVLEHVLSQGPIIQVDANLGQSNSRGKMHCRLFCDPQFPDVAYRWSQLNFPANPKEEPEAEIFCIPHYLENPIMPESGEMLRVLRFPHHNYSIVTATSYQGECKKGFLSHWIYHIYKKGGTGEHASLKEFTIKRLDGSSKRIVMAVWGLTGSGKSTHGMYVITKEINKKFIEKFNVDLLSFVSDQVIKNDDIIGVFSDCVVSPERGSWTKTEDVDKSQIAMYNAGISHRALHENTEFDSNGNVSFKGQLFQYHGKPNQNARTVFYLEDTKFHDGNVDSTAPLNMAVFISPGYISDFAWLKLSDAAFIAKILADGRTTGHPAQGRKGVGQEKYETRYCLPFTFGVGNSKHIERFYEFVKKREGTASAIDVFLINTTGRVGAKFDWVEIQLGESSVTIPKTKFEEVGGKIKPIGGTGPTIEETEFFLFQASRGAVKYENHPIWGSKVLVPVAVEGLSPKRLEELNPFSYHTLEDMKKLLYAQIVTSKFYLDKQCPGLPDYIYNAMDF